MRAFTALLKKDLRTTWRSPLFAVITILIPVAFTILYAVVIHVSTTATIAVADKDQTAESRAFIQTMEEMSNADGEYYEILTTDPATADDLYDDGDAGSLLTVPDGFGSSHATGERPEVQLKLFNINADGTKNQHLRLEQAMLEYRSDNPAAGSPRVSISESTVLDRDIPISWYLGSALFVFAALYAGMVNTGTSLTREWEGRTAKELMMSPHTGIITVLGKWASSAIISALTLAVTGLALVWILEIPLQHLGPRSLTAIGLVWLYGAGIGTLLAMVLRKSLPLIPVAVILAVAHFLACGYESYIRGFAHGGVVELLWRSTSWIPLSHLFDTVRFELTGLSEPPGFGAAILSAVALTSIVVALSLWRMTRSLRFSQGQ